MRVFRRGVLSQGYYDHFSALSKSSAHPDARGFYKSSPSIELIDSTFKHTHDEKQQRFTHIISKKIHGVSFSPYLSGQAPGDVISASQLSERLSVISPYAHWIRTFSCAEGHQLIPCLAQQQGLKIMVGVSIGDSRASNEIELMNAIEIAKSGHADILAVGNEVLLRGDLTEEELLDYIQRAKQAVPDVLVAYVDAYFLFEKYPRIAEQCDVLLINCYPYWEMTPVQYALSHMKEMYQRTCDIAGGKRVIISETGWPSEGAPFGEAIPSINNAMTYFISACQWADEEGIEMFYFSSFDEPWKQRDEGEVGAHWGLWDSEGSLKYL
ncbi:UNVERIFIED_CONTAM: hypothetical protein GTU68_041381 [Idotea baltica]|nr:hypothetical protein [Idotea baltica]